MEIVVNGKVREVEAGMALSQLVAEVGLAGKRVAVEVNLEIVPRSQHDECRLQPGDRIEVVAAIGGGGSFTV